jgi:GntR family transcriptional regulator
MKDTMTRPKHKTNDDLLDLLSSVDLQSSVAVYVQIENHVQFAISSGRLKPGDQLPAVRELSERLKVNTNTVSKAYRDLVVMGLLYTRRGMGVFVSKDIEEKCKEDCRRRVLIRLNEVVCESRAAGFDDKEIVEIVEKVLKLKSNPYGVMAPSLAAYLRRRK